MADSPSQTPAELTEFLSDQKAEGTRDSEGVFTIDLKMAKRKLAAFQLATPESWIVVLVQAANRGAASKVTVTQFPRQTVVAIHGGRPWKWAELQSVLDGAETTEGDLLAYATVVRALTGNSQLRAFVVETPDGMRASWNGREIKTGPMGVEELLKDAPTVFEVHHLPEFSEQKSVFFEDRGTARATLVAISRALSRSCLASGVPIWCDGRKISGIHLGEPPPSYHYRRPVAVLGIPEERIPPADFSAAMEVEPTRLGAGDLLIDNRGSQTLLAAMVVVTATVKRGSAPSCVTWPRSSPPRAFPICSGWTTAWLSGKARWP